MNFTLVLILWFILRIPKYSREKHHLKYCDKIIHIIEFDFILNTNLANATRKTVFYYAIPSKTQIYVYKLRQKETKLEVA